MKLLLNKAHFPVRALGPGTRIGLWFQGCSIRCRGCCSQDTWELDASRAIDVAAVISWCLQSRPTKVDGITITGGEPFDQPEALLLLLKSLVAFRKAGGDLLLYSGYPAKRLKADFAEHLRYVDAYVAEPYVLNRPANSGVAGSKNQKLTVRSTRRKVVERYLVWEKRGAERQIQVQAHSNAIWFIGVPRAGDLERMRAYCETQGLTFDTVSWRY